jgi:muramoyltetrapeptide carboxypeptidase
MFQDRGIPILAGFEMGHGSENITLPMGLEAELNTEDGSLRFKEAAVEDGVT